MPWFFFKAGMFFKKEPLGKVIKKSYQRLIIPFIVFTIVGELLKLAINIYTVDESILDIIKHNTLSACVDLIKFGCSIGNITLWFLLSLFCVRVIYNFLSNSRLYPLLLVLCAIAPAMHYLEIKWPYYLANISAGLFFYAMGDKCRNFRINSLVLCLLLCAAWIALSIYMPTVVDMRLNYLWRGYYFLWYPTSLIGIFTLNSLSFRGFFNFPLFQYLGQHSMGYYCVHFMILTSMEMLLPPSLRYGYPYVIIAVLMMIFVLPLILWGIRRSRYGFLID